MYKMKLFENARLIEASSGNVLWDEIIADEPRKSGVKKSEFKPPRLKTDVPWGMHGEIAVFRDEKGKYIGYCSKATAKAWLKPISENFVSGAYAYNQYVNVEIPKGVVIPEYPSTEQWKGIKQSSPLTFAYHMIREYMLVDNRDIIKTLIDRLSSGATNATQVANVELDKIYVDADVKKAIEKIAFEEEKLLKKIKADNARKVVDILKNQLK